MTTTDTPRTDLKELKLSEVKYPHDFYALADLCRQLERELKNAQEAYLKSVERDDYLTQELAASQAEVEKIKEENRKFRELCERAIDDAVDALEERDLKRRIADEIESRRKELMELTKSTN
jgi:uroporphyrinogen-III synthase